MYILALRQPRRAVPTIEEWWKHPKPLYRLAAWRIASGLAERTTILPVLDRQALLRAYAAEQETDIRAEVAKLLGETKASFAVDALISHLPGHRQTASEKEFRATMEKGLGPGAINESFDTDIRSLFERTRPKHAQVGDNEGCSTLRALGSIGDSRATGAVIEVALGSSNWSSACHKALGRIGSEEAIDFLIAHLHDSEAVRALGLARSKKAILALKHLQTELTAAPDRNEREKRPSLSGRSADIQEPNRRRLDGVRIALIQIEDPNPVESLMRIAENRKESEETRAEAVEGLEPLDISGSLDRIVRLCRSNDNASIWLGCANLLAGRRGKDVSNALTALLNGPTPGAGTANVKASMAVGIMSHTVEISQGTGDAALDDNLKPPQRNSDK